MTKPDFEKMFPEAMFTSKVNQTLAVAIAESIWDISYSAGRADERERCTDILRRRYMGDNNREDREVKRCIVAITKGE